MPSKPATDAVSAARAAADPSPARLTGELWGGFAAALVALPSAIAFGVTALAPLGPSAGAWGALGGLIGAAALGLVAPALGGTPRLITAPCAPAAAVLAALCAELATRGMAPEAALVSAALVALAAGLLQVAFGAAGLGRLIRFMPYPVVSGYLSGVGLVVVFGQIPRLLQGSTGTQLAAALTAPGQWRWEALVVGAVTIVTMAGAPKLTRAVPAAVLAFAAGGLAYVALALHDPALLRVEHNPLLIGRLGGTGDASNLGDSTWGAFTMRAGALRALGLGDLAQLAAPALTLAALLSIDTLKTCVVLDSLTRSRHAPNRELVAQGVANAVSALAGGVPGAGQMGATLVNLSSGGRTRLSGMVEGAVALAALLLLAPFIAWVPIPALAGVLCVVGARMLDVHSIRMLRAHSTLLDFAVIVCVIAVALMSGLVEASATGLALAVLLYLRAQVGARVLFRKSYGNQLFSKQVRLPREREVLEREGARTAAFELQGNLFFGTSQQLLDVLGADLAQCRFVILDLRRVESIDVTAAHVLEQIGDTLDERGGVLLFSNLPRRAPSGQDMAAFLGDVGLVREGHRGHVFSELDDALEWVEERLLEEAHVEHTSARAMELRELELFRGRREDTLAALAACAEARSYKAGQPIFARGDVSDELLLIRRGRVRVTLPVAGGREHHVASFRRGDFLGEMAFLDGAPRSANAVAAADTELFAISRRRFDALAEEHRKLGMSVLESVARTLAVRLRHADAELARLHEA